MKRRSIILIPLALLPMPVVAQDIPPLKEAKLIVEHNATDLDTGFQGFVDGEGWQSLTLSGPSGDLVRFEALGPLHGQGLTELFFETVEPLNTETPIETTLGWLPEGKYSYEAVSATGGAVSGEIEFSHAIPAGPALLAPLADEVVDIEPLTVRWEAVDKTITGEPVEIIAYQLIIEKDATPHSTMIGKYGLSMYLPATTTSIEVPAGFLEAGAAYNWEVLTIAANGNQTLSSSAFSVE